MFIYVYIVVISVILFDDFRGKSDWKKNVIVIIVVYIYIKKKITPHVSFSHTRVKKNQQNSRLWQVLINPFTKYTRDSRFVEKKIKWLYYCSAEFGVKKKTRSGCK